MLTMLLGGLWHGAGWTFVIWGGLHGLALALNHGWRHLTGNDRAAIWPGRAFAAVLTFLFVTTAWVFFRAGSLDTASNILAGMAGLNGVVLPETYGARLGALGDMALGWGWRFEEMYLFLGLEQVLWLTGLLALAWLRPNALEWTRYSPPDGEVMEPRGLWRRLSWRPSVLWALCLSGMAVLSLVLMSRTGEFLYFQF